MLLQRELQEFHKHRRVPEMAHRAREIAGVYGSIESRDVVIITYIGTRMLFTRAAIVSNIPPRRGTTTIEIVA